MKKELVIQDIVKNIKNIKNKLISFSEDKNPLVRSEAIKAMGLFYDGDIDNAILRGLKDKDELVRIEALDNIILPQNINKVFKKIAKLLKDKDPLVRAYAIDALAYNNAIMYKNKIKNLLHQKNINDELKVSIYFALVKFGDKKYLKKLFKLLNNENYKVRCATVNLLYFLANKKNNYKFIKKLKKVLKKEKTKAVRSCIKNTIKDLKEL